MTWTSDPAASTRPLVIIEWGLPFLDVRVFGVPKPQGSKRAWAYVPAEVMAAAVAAGNPRMVRPQASLAEDNAAVRDWRTDLMLSIRGALRRPWTPVDGPVRADLVFYMPKPVSAPKRRRTWPHKKPDIDKLTRAVFDALTDAKAWQDDARCVMLTARKDYADEVNPPGVWIRLWRVPEAQAAASQGEPPVVEGPGTVPLPGM